MNDLAKNVIQPRILSFLQWAENEQYASYDWWDIWGTTYGAWAKKLYFKNKYIGSPFLVPFFLADLMFPGFRKFFVRKRTFPICHAHFALGHLNLYEVNNDVKHLNKAESFVDGLLSMASPKANGLGWGMKHKWMTIQGMIPVDTPCNTQTAYAYELFARLLDITGKIHYKTYLTEILRHVSNDFYEWQNGDTLAASYSTIDKRKVVNANSYRMYMLIDGGIRLSDQSYVDKGLATLRYILSQQREDGSWPYSEDQDFVDCYHTVFVLKNLVRVKKHLPGDTRLDESIQRGLKYYQTHLFDEHKLPKPFSVRPRLTIFKYDGYDFAETIGFLSDINYPKADLEKIIKFAVDNFQTKDGWFVFRIYHLPVSKGIPYMRYANSGMFHGLSKALKYYSGDDTKNRSSFAQ